MPTQVVIFAKAPVEGFAKTRLIPRRMRMHLKR